MSTKNAAADRRDEIIAENINFMYGRSKENAAFDSDKRSFVKSNKFVNPFDTISDFTGKHSFLLPSFETDVFLPSEPKAYPSYEHALQASRFSAVDERDTIRNTALIRDVKKMTPKFRSNRGESWKQECINVAERLLRDKFIRSKELTSLLKETGKKSLVYANSYGEHFWGSPVDNHSKGQNHLGKLLEKIRNDIANGEDIDLWLTNQIKIIGQDEIEINLHVEKNGEVITDDNQFFERRPKLFMGKAELNDIVTAHSSTSRTHAALVVGTLQGCTGVEAYIVDFLSSNGTFVNGSRIPPYVFTAVTREHLVTAGASSRSYRFLVDTERNARAKDLLYNRMANPSILSAKVEEQNNENTVFVGNIPFEAAEADIQEFFSICGAILSVNMPKDKEKPGGEHRGIAFVTFASSSGLVQALSRGGDELMGRNIAVKRREAKATAAPSGAKKATAASDQPSYYTGTAPAHTAVRADSAHDRGQEQGQGHGHGGSRPTRFSSSSGSAGNAAASILPSSLGGNVPRSADSQSSYHKEGSRDGDDSLHEKSDKGHSSRGQRDSTGRDRDGGREGRSESSARRHCSKGDSSRSRDRDRRRGDRQSRERSIPRRDGCKGGRSPLTSGRDRARSSDRDRSKERGGRRGDDRMRRLSVDRRSSRGRGGERSRSRERGGERNRGRERSRSRERGGARPAVSRSRSSSDED